MSELDKAVSHLQRTLQIYDAAKGEGQTIEAVGGVLAASRATVRAHWLDKTDRG